MIFAIHIRRLLIVVFLAVLAACESAPVPETGWVPEIRSVDVAPGASSAEMTAVLKSAVTGRCSCGFRYGMSESSMMSVSGKPDGKTISAEVFGLSPDTEYIFMAYVNNGKGEVCSELMSFRTCKEGQSQPDIPVQPSEYELTISVSTMTVAAAACTFDVTVGGNAGYEVLMPDADWISHTRDGRLCVFSLTENPSETYSRNCTVSFRSLNHDCTRKLSVCQKNKEVIIVFEDELVKSACVAACDADRDGEVSTKEAAGVRDLNDIDLRGKPITSFDEFRYFTSVDEIPGYYFSESDLSSIEFPTSLKRIGQEAFSYCICLEEVEIPSSVTYMGPWAFAFCSNLRKAVLPDTVTTMEEQVFRSCYNLKEVNLPKCLTEIAANMFYQCYSLESITLPENLKYIRLGVFHDCGALTEITIPAGVKSIGDNAFVSCLALKHVLMKPLSPPVLGFAPFSGCSEDMLINVPSEALHLYMSAGSWSSYTGYIVAANEPL